MWPLNTRNGKRMTKIKKILSLGNQSTMDEASVDENPHFQLGIFQNKRGEGGGAP